MDCCCICYLEVSSDIIGKCPKCNFECCKECWKKYILGGIENGICMNCQTPFTKHFLTEIGGKMWLSRDSKGTYKSFLKNIYVEKEKAKIPETLIYIQNQKEKADMKRELKKLEDEIKSNVEYIEKNRIIRKKMKCVINYIYFKYIKEHPNDFIGNSNRFVYIFENYPTLKQWERFNITKEQMDYFHQMFEKNKHVLKNLKNIEKYKTEGYTKGLDTQLKIGDLTNKLFHKEDQPDTVTTQFIQGCPYEDCRGLIEMKKFKCSICSKKICKKCRIPKSKDTKHECKKEDIDSVNLIKSDSKTCPKCSTLIFRISGCTMMWCTQCHVAFDWKTGKIETGKNIHNPHYIEFIRSRGMSMHDNNECGDDIPRSDIIFHRLSTPVLEIRGKQDLNYMKTKHILIDYNTIAMIGYLIEHGIQVFVASLEAKISEERYETYSYKNKLLYYRSKYLQSNITEKEWKKKIYEIYKNTEIEKFYIEVFNSLRMVLMESYKKLYVDLGDPIPMFKNKKLYDDYVDKKNNILKVFLDYTEEARNYFNESIVLENSFYGSSMNFFFIGPCWDIMKYIEYKKHGLQRPSTFIEDTGIKKTYQIYNHQHAMLPRVWRRENPRLVIREDRPLRNIVYDDEEEEDEIVRQIIEISIISDQEKSSKDKEEYVPSSEDDEIVIEDDVEIIIEE